MRACPVCHCALDREDYEGFTIMRCPSCRGHLLSSEVLEGIKRSPRQSPDQLQQELDTSGYVAMESGKALRCPRCKGEMRKELIGTPLVPLHEDACKRCALVWFDGGELVIAQLLHETSCQRFQNANELRARMLEIESTPEHRARLETAIARLPKGADSTLNQALSEIGSETEKLLVILFRIFVSPRPLDPTEQKND